MKMSYLDKTHTFCFVPDYHCHSRDENNSKEGEKADVEQRYSMIFSKLWKQTCMYRTKYMQLHSGQKSPTYHEKINILPKEQNPV